MKDIKEYINVNESKSNLSFELKFKSDKTITRFIELLNRGVAYSDEHYNTRDTKLMGDLYKDIIEQLKNQGLMLEK